MPDQPQPSGTPQPGIERSAVDVIPPALGEACACSGRGRTVGPGTKEDRRLAPAAGRTGLVGDGTGTTANDTGDPRKPTPRRNLRSSASEGRAPRQVLPLARSLSARRATRSRGRSTRTRPGDRAIRTRLRARDISRRTGGRGRAGMGWDGMGRRKRGAERRGDLWAVVYSRLVLIGYLSEARRRQVGGSLREARSGLSGPEEIGWRGWGMCFSAVGSGARLRFEKSLWWVVDWLRRSRVERGSEEAML
ncbi:unnamed protein product [Diplocarpon coronariae]